MRYSNNSANDDEAEYEDRKLKNKRVASSDEAAAEGEERKNRNLQQFAVNLAKPRTREGEGITQYNKRETIKFT